MTQYGLLATAGAALFVCNSNPAGQRMTIGNKIRFIKRRKTTSGSWSAARYSSGTIQAHQLPSGFKVVIVIQHARLVGIDVVLVTPTSWNSMPDARM